MRSLVAVLALVVLLFMVSTAARADGDDHYTVGEELQHHMAICLDLSDAKAIVDAHRTGGMEAAKKIWDAADRCRNLPVGGGPRVGKVVYAAIVEMNGEKVTVRVVEIVPPGGGAAIAYFMTTLEVRPAGRGV